MLFSKAEMEILRLCAWCKELPRRKSENLPAEIVSSLLEAKLIRVTRNKLSYRLTPAAYEVLQKAGFDYVLDPSYRTDESIIARRLRGAEIALFFQRYGVDVFAQTPPAKKQGRIYLAAYALRQEPQKLLWYTQMKGFYYTGDYMFIPYYVVPDNKGIYTNNEQREFMSQDILMGRKPFVIFTGNGVLEGIVDGIMTPKERSQKQTYDTFAEAFDLFGCPTAVIPLDENGMRTLEVLQIPNYRQKLVQALLGDNYAPPINESFDALNKQTGQNYVLGFDCNIPRLQRAYRQSIDNQACMNLTKPQKFIYDMERFAGESINVLCVIMLLPGVKVEADLTTAVNQVYQQNDAFRIRISEEDSHPSQ